MTAIHCFAWCSTAKGSGGLLTPVACLEQRLRQLARWHLTLIVLHCLLPTATFAQSGKGLGTLVKVLTGAAAAESARRTVDGYDRLQRHKALADVAAEKIRYES